MSDQNKILTPQEIAKKLLDPAAYEAEQKQKAETAKKIAAKKAEELKKQAAVPKRSYFDVKLEVLLPGILTYRILAEDANQALQLIKNRAPNNITYKLPGKRDLIVRVYEAGSCIIRLTKRLAGA